jgi:hypothetical protein
MTETRPVCVMNDHHDQRANVPMTSFVAFWVHAAKSAGIRAREEITAIRTPSHMGQMTLSLTVCVHTPTSSVVSRANANMRAGGCPIRS